MYPSNLDTWTVLEDMLVAIVTQAAAFGGPLGVQPNADGTTGVQSIERIVPASKAIFPSIGLMCVEYNEEITGQAKHDLVTRFIIALSVRQSHSPSISDLSRAALQSLRAYQNDGAGNGLSPLLRSNVTLGGLCQWAQIKSMERHVFIKDSDSSDVIATALYTFEVHDSVRISAITTPPATIPPDLSIATGSAGGILALFRSAPSGLAVAFSDESYADGSAGPISRWAWNFGDSIGTSTVQNPSYTFGAPGTYTVTLVVTTAGGAQSTVTAPVTVT